VATAAVPATSKLTTPVEVKEAAMFSKALGRGKIAAVAMTGAVVVLGAGACGVTGTGGTAPASPGTSHPAAQQAGSQQSGASQPGPAQAGNATGHVTSAAAVPWNSVGAGWVLDTYSAGTRSKPAPTTLYLISPAGAKYALLTWPASATPAPIVRAWAGDKTEALFQLFAPGGSPGGYGELNLTTGTMTRVGFANASTTPLGYTLPHGEQILAATDSGSDTIIARFTRAGALAQTLITEHDTSGASYSPDGTALAASAPDGLLLVANSGGRPKKLPVPVPPRGACDPVRWWDARTILASCGGLWLVPASGAAPSQLTPVRPLDNAVTDLGDIDAWQLPSGLYLQSVGACGTLELNKQAGNGALARVTVPGMTYSPVVVTASATELLMEQQGCHGSGGELAWFNPATGAEQWIFRTGAGPSAIAYNDPRNGAIH
jgi:TolB protein